jgi:HEAT repeat protein
VTDECRRAIDVVLDDAPEVVVRPEHLDQRRGVVERLKSLPPDCSSALEQRAEILLADFGPRTAEQLTMVLEAMRLRGQGIADHAGRALSAPGSAEREPFVELLAIAAPDSAVQVLQDVFARFDEDADPEGFLRARILRALGDLRARHAAEVIIPALSHDDSERVREAAVRSLAQLEAKEAVPALIKRLEEDSDPDVVALAARTLGDWGVEAAVPALETLAQSEWAQRSPEVRDATQAALTDLH